MVCFSGNQQILYRLYKDSFPRNWKIQIKLHLSIKNCFFSPFCVHHFLESNVFGSPNIATLPLQLEE